MLRFDFSKGFDFGGNFQIAVFGYQESARKEKKINWIFFFFLGSVVEMTRRNKMKHC